MQKRTKYANKSTQKAKEYQKDKESTKYTKESTNNAKKTTKNINNSESTVNAKKLQKFKKPKVPQYKNLENRAPRKLTSIEYTICNFF